MNSWVFTVGKDVVFGKKEYKPETAIGQQRLAHELTHGVLIRHSNTIEKTLPIWYKNEYILNKFTRRLNEWVLSYAAVEC